MDMKKRTSSAGYRLPDPRNMTQSLVSVGPSKIQSTGANKDSSPETCDPVKQDQVWREFVHAEMKGTKEWQKNWSFLKNYDQLGELRSETPLPRHVSLYSAHLPNTANQMFGSRLYTQLGMELVRMDKMLLLSRNHHKCKRSVDLLSC